MRHRQVVFELPQPVELPTGNVYVLPLEPATTTDTATAPVEPHSTRRHQPSRGWEIHDGDDSILESTFESRAEALRYMCVVALRSISLPLTLYGPDGKPTGDRLA